jgi:hypothetical protein
MFVRWRQLASGPAAYASMCEWVGGKPIRRHWGRVSEYRAGVITRASKANARDRREESERKAIDANPPLDDVEVMLESRLGEVMRDVTCHYRAAGYHHHRYQWRLRGKPGRRPRSGQEADTSGGT